MIQLNLLIEGENRHFLLHLFAYYFFEFPS